MTARKPRKPPGLGVEGATLWVEVCSEMADDGLVPDSRERRWLLAACREADLLVALMESFAGQPHVVTGSQKQPVAHPLIAEIRQHRVTLSALLARVNMAESGEAVGRGGRTTSTMARAAAFARHGSL